MSVREHPIKTPGEAISAGFAKAFAVHELKNSVHGILTYIALLSKKMNTDEVDQRIRADVQRYLQIMQAEFHRCDAIVARLLDASHLPPASSRPVDVYEMVERSLTLVRSRMERQNITVVKKKGKNPRKILGDPEQLQQVITNVIVNACEAMPRGGRLTIAINNDDTDCVRLVFSDTGCGIPKREMAKIFDPFFSTKSRRQGRNMGLGLSLVRSVVHQHNGKIEVRSKVGRGTTFTIQLPGTTQGNESGEKMGESSQRPGGLS